jgi:site-specific DNA recombinase
MSSINGDRVRGNGILQNDLYRGMLVFNRTRRTQDPKTRRKRIRVRPREEWIVRPAPELRIVSDELWQAVSARRARFDGTRMGQQKRPKRLLSGLVSCGLCGGNYVLIGPEKWGCSNHRHRGDCPNGRTIQSHMLRRRVFAGLRRELLDPEIVRTFVLEYHREAQERASRDARDCRKLEQRQAKARRDVERLLRAVTDGGSEFAEIRNALAGARAQLASIEAELADNAAGSVIALHPGIAEEYRRNIDGLLELLERPPEDEDAQFNARQRFRSLIQSVVVVPAESGPGTAVTLEARLTALLDLAAGRAVTEGRVCFRWCPGGDSNADIHSLKRAKV